nr:MFS transporter [Amylolactobacillus amylophilus]
MVNTGVNSTATLIKSKQTSYIFNVLYFTSNLGLVFGSLIVGLILPLGITYIFLLAFILFAGFSVVIVLEFKGLNDAKEAVKSGRETELTGAGTTFDRTGIILVLVCLFVSWIAYEQWQSNISTYMISLGMSVRSYSLLWTLNGILIVFFQPLLTHFDDFLTQHLRGRLYTGFILFAVAFLFLITATHYAAFMIAMAVLTIGEILAFPAVSTFVNDRASLLEKGKYQGSSWRQHPPDAPLVP